MDHQIVIFDGVCNLCNAVVRCIIDRDPDARFRYASLQSRAGERLLREHGLDEGDVDSVLLVAAGQVYSRSTAVLRIARGLGWPWALLAGFFVVPESIRDWIYGFVACHRYDWFGRSDECRIPSPRERTRFMD